MSKRKVAIACQGGGSHAAFAAGVLYALLDRQHDEQFEPVALSGTSGGAVCASLVWSGLVSGKPDPRAEAVRRLLGFWRDLEARWPLDAWINAWAVAVARLPVTLEISPYFCFPFAELRMRQLLEDYLELEKLPGYPRLPAHPRLYIGVTDVLRGEGKPRTGEKLTYDDILASAAIPPIFRAVRIDGSYYWDGLFSRNPPIREFTDLPVTDRPDEIWVVRINPIERREEPVGMREINDRRNELAGNLALDQELYHISKVNQLIADGKLTGYKPIALRQVQQPSADLDYPSKLDRSPALLQRLFDAGAGAAADFLSHRSVVEHADLRDRVKPREAPATPAVTGPARRVA